MKRRFLIALFSFGTIFGFGSGIASMAMHTGHHHAHRRAAFERHVADVCVDAAERARDRDRPRYEEPPPPPMVPHGPRHHRWEYRAW